MNPDVERVTADRAEPADRDEFGTGPLGPGYQGPYGRDSDVTLWRALTFPGARKWYFGGIFALAWLVFLGVEYFSRVPNIWVGLGVGFFLVVFAAAFEICVPLTWWLRPEHRIWVVLGFWALTLGFWPIMQWSVAGTWAFVGTIAAMSMFTMRTTAGLVALIALMAVGFEYCGGVRGPDLVPLPAIIASISMMMAGFSRQIATVNELRATQHRMAALAVEEERGRVARDIHDILGHSLTVITVKAELAGRLVERDAIRAKAEINDVEQLSRAALTDVRATVAGYRDVNVVSELANARAVLEAAGITADLPTTTDTLPAEYRELAGWIIREGVTNVVRHSGATLCRVRMSPDMIEVADDGTGPQSGSAHCHANGLDGLRERVEAAGALLRIGTSDLGGFSLQIRSKGLT
ncbi:sensor histidine kinase [Spelaeicoccus albus]